MTCAVDAPADATVTIRHINLDGDNNQIALSCGTAVPPFQWDVCDDPLPDVVVISAKVTSEPEQWLGTWRCIVDTLTESNDSSTELTDILRM